MSDAAKALFWMGVSVSIGFLAGWFAYAKTACFERWLIKRLQSQSIASDK